MLAGRVGVETKLAGTEGVTEASAHQGMRQQLCRSPVCHPHCCDVPALVCDGLDRLQHTKLVLHIQEGCELIQ